MNFTLNRFIVQPGITYISRGGYQKFVNSNPSQPSDFQVQYYPKYLELPVNILYAVNTGKTAIQIGGGAYFAYAIGGSGKGNGVLFGTSYSNYITKIPFSDDMSGALSALDYGINGVVNLPINNNIGLNLNYSHGISNISLGNTPNNGFVTDVNNRTWEISAIYTF